MEQVALQLDSDQSPGGDFGEGGGGGRGYASVIEMDLNQFVENKNLKGNSGRRETKQEEQNGKVL